MTKIKIKKTFIFFIVFTFFLINKAYSADLILNTSKETLGTGEQFYIDLMLDPEDQSINTIMGDISYSGDNLTFMRAEEGKSMVNLWIEKPKYNKEKKIINFAGIMTNGFDGVIDPFNPGDKLPGLIIRLVFETKRTGTVNFFTSNFSLNLNDGLGTEIIAKPVNKSIEIMDYENIIKYTNKDSDPSPKLEAYITRDPNIFKNKYILIFKASDKNSGIKSIKIKEGWRDWKEIESPYVLMDQSRHADINLQALNYEGAGIIINIDGLPFNWRLIERVIIISFVIIIIFLIARKYKIKNKK